METTKTIRAFAMGMLEYLATNRDARKGEGGGAGIPTSVIRDRLQGVGLKSTQIGKEHLNQYQGWLYAAVRKGLDQRDDQPAMPRLATSVPAVEQSSPIFRILDVKWELRAERENPYNPGTVRNTHRAPHGEDRV